MVSPRKHLGNTVFIITAAVYFLICLCFNTYMNIPFLNKNQDPYGYPDEEADKKKKIIIFGSIIVVVLLGMLLLFGGGGDDQPGLANMKQSIDSTNGALGIIKTYKTELSNSGTVNDIALIEIILNGNFQKLNDFYKANYKAKSISPQEKPDEATQEILDRSVRNNTVDTDIIEPLKLQIADAEKSLKLAAQEFTVKANTDLVNKSIEDLNSVQGVLDKPR